MSRFFAVVTILGIFGSAGLGQGRFEGPLPGPVRTLNTVEVCLNSRYSQHTLARTEPTKQQISNILWAASVAPMTGTYRRFYLYTTAGTYLYDPNRHQLVWYSSELTREGAFSIGYQADKIFDAGTAYMFALLAAVSLSNSPEPALASCPKGLGLPATRLYFALQPVRPLTSRAVARSSLPEGKAGWLAQPDTIGIASLESVLSRLNYTDCLGSRVLTNQQLSQLLWAAYGCTDHTTSNGRAGLVVPSAYASYYLTGRIWLVDVNGLARYINRNPVMDLTTRDHRLESVTGVGSRIQLPSPSQIKPRLQAVLAGLPDASCYVILCLDKTNASQEFAQLETGFVAANLLIQATAMDLGCHFRRVLASEQSLIQAATGIPVADLPQVVISIGQVLKGDADLDGRVDMQDLAIVAKSWRLSWGQDGYEPSSDLDRSGHVDHKDLALIAEGWLATTDQDLGP